MTTSAAEYIAASVNEALGGVNHEACVVTGYSVVDEIVFAVSVLTKIARSSV